MAAARPALGALLRLLTNVTAELSGQTYTMSLLPSLLTDTVVRSDDDDVRAGLYGALRNLCYVSGYHTEDEVREARHRELIEEREIVAVLLRPLNAEGNCDLGDETLASPLPPPPNPPHHLGEILRLRGLGWGSGLSPPVDPRADSAADHGRPPSPRDRSAR